VLGALAAWMWVRLLQGDPVGLPTLPDVDPLYLMSGSFFLVLLLVMVGSSVAAGRSPHVVYRPEQIDVRLSDVKGLGPVTEDVRRSIDLLLAGRTFRREMGGTPRRGLLFEGPPGTGKTHLAKAMAAEAGVPFLFVSATSFQSMYYGATSRKIRSYFAALRKAARTEGAAIGFIEEIDAIATSRGGLSMTAAPTAASGSAGLRSAHCGGLTGLPMSPAFSGSASASASVTGLGSNAMVVQRAAVSEGVGGVVNELLVQMQSFDALTGWQRVQGALIDAANLFLPEHRLIPRPRPEPVDVLLIAATNRADSLDPALLRPGRFDRRLGFSAPDKAGRRELIDHFLARKSHDAVLGTDERRDALAGITQDYTPVMIEHLLDEALVNAVRRGAREMSWADVEHARLVTEVGLGQPVAYTAHEKALIATHEAGHAVTAWLVAPARRLEVLTIIRRAGSLGLLAHGDAEDVYTRSRHELEHLVQIAFGGQVAEELFFSDSSTGAGGDLSYATTLAAQMVGASGMGDSLVSLAAAGGGPLDGGLTGRVLGDDRARRQVESLLCRQKAVTTGLLNQHRHLVEALRDALIERHELIGHEITDVLEAAASAARVIDLRPEVRREIGGRDA
jgi:cell division protease FtsH